ncbi:glycoside hydrolase, partial [Hanseniaspora valbyensis NRRL Y-1626]
FFPKDIDMRHTTHIYYSFISIDSKTGNVYLQDIEADTKLKTEEMKENDVPIMDHVFPDFNPYDYSLKEQKKFKLIMSIGGWSQKNNFSNLSKKTEHLNNFIDSCINLVLSNGFDGIDIDWEYPTKKKDIDTYIEIFKRLRARFDKLEQEIFSNKQKKIKKEKWFYLSTAIPCDEEVLSKLDLKKIEPFVDCFNLMGYDLSGEWSEYTAYHSNLFDDPNNKDSSSVDSVVKYMLYDLKLSSQKIILGMPLYGRSFTNVKIQNSKIIGVPFKGVDNDFDKDSPGIWPYSAIFDLKYTFYYDEKLVAAYVYNEKKKHLIVFDDYNCIGKKAEYIKKMNLGGGFFWEANGER